jgi:hypothetical protein
VIQVSQKEALPIPMRFGNDDHRQAMKNMNEYRPSTRRFSRKKGKRKIVSS